MIHQYKLGGYNIVLDVCSGGLHVVDDLSYDIIAGLNEIYEHQEKLDSARACARGAAETADGGVEDGMIDIETLSEKVLLDMEEKYKGTEMGDPKEIRACYEQIMALKEQGKLFTKDSYEPMAGDLKARTSGVVKALCLHIAHTCNLNCSYCFASQGKYHGDRAVMSFEVGKRALDFLIENSGSRHNLEVDFFGGEPLMNFQVVKDLVAYARSIEKEKGKNFRFTLTTNGVLIDDDVIEFANRECSNVVLSLDGRKEIHDRFRVDYAGNGSWEKIVPKFQKLVEARGGKNYYMRGTFTHANPDFLEDDPSRLTEEDLPIVLDQYEKLAELMIERDREGKPFTFYHYMIDLKGGPCIYKRISGCGSGTEYMAVTPWGDLYPCHQFVGEEKFLLGNIFDGVKNTAIQDDFAACNVYAREECRGCWARLYCSGGCAANAYHATGSVRGVYKYGCELFKKRIECALMVAIHREFADN